MSGALGLAADFLGIDFPLLQLGYRGRMLRGSFRGIPFHVEEHELQGGRRGVLYEFPDRDRPATEDLGKAAERFSLDAFVIGDDYDLDRDALLRAVFDTKGPGLLVHPYLGERTVQMMDGCSVRERISPSRIAHFRLVCVDAGADGQPRAGISTFARLFGQAVAVLAVARAAYSIAVAVQHRPSFLLGFLTAGLGNVAESLIGLPAGTTASLRGTIAGITAAPADNFATAAAIAGAFQGVAEIYAVAPPIGADLSGGLAALATWSGIALPPDPTITPDRAQEAVNAQALLDLARGCAVAALAQLYAQLDFTSAEDATAARAQLVALIGDRADAAAVAGDDDGYAAWLALAAAATADLTQRAEALPRRATYRVPATRPSLVLAQRLYQSSDQADSLADLNGVLHPGFMPASGLWLQP